MTGYNPPTTTNRPNQDRTIRIWIEAENTTDPLDDEQTWEFHVAHTTNEGEHINEIRDLVAHIDDALNRDAITPDNIDQQLAVAEYRADTDRVIADINDDHPALDAVELPHTVAAPGDTSTVTIDRRSLTQAYTHTITTAEPPRRVHINLRTGDSIISSGRTPPGYYAIDADKFVRCDPVDAEQLIDPVIGGITYSDGEAWRDALTLRSELPAEHAPGDDPVHIEYVEPDRDRSPENANRIPTRDELAD